MTQMSPAESYASRPLRAGRKPVRVDGSRVGWEATTTAAAMTAGEERDGKQDDGATREDRERKGQSHGTTFRDPPGRSAAQSGRADEGLVEDVLGRMRLRAFVKPGGDESVEVGWAGHAGPPMSWPVVRLVAVAPVGVERGAQERVDRNSRDLTVPSGRPSASAVSWSGSPT